MAALDTPENRPPQDRPDQRDALLEAQRQAHAGQPDSFKPDALDDKQVRVEPDGTGPTSTATFDTDRDQAAGSGNDGER